MFFSEKMECCPFFPHELPLSRHLLFFHPSGFSFPGGPPIHTHTLRMGLAIIDAFSHSLYFFSTVIIISHFPVCISVMIVYGTATKFLPLIGACPA